MGILDCFFIVIIVMIITSIICGIAYWYYLTNKQKETNDLATKLMESKGFKVTNNIGDLFIDEENKKWTVGRCGTVYDYSDLIDISVSENGIKEKLSGGVGVGIGLGNASLQASSSRSIQTTIRLWTIDLTVNNSKTPLVQIELYRGSPIKKGEFTYNSIDLLKNKYLAQLNYIKSTGKQLKSTANVWQIIEDNKNEIEKNKSPRVKRHDKRTIDITTKIVGVTKENDRGVNIQTLLPTLSEDSDIILSREKDNPYDCNAIKVVADYQHIGYLKASVAEEVAPVIDSGEKVYVEILDITGGGDKNFGCNIHVFTK